MKTILKKILLNTLAIGVVSQVAPGLSYGNDLKTLLTAALALALINAFLRPFLKILLLPITVITLGLMGWLVNVVVLYVTSLVVSGFEIMAFDLQVGDTSLVLNRFWAFVVVSFLLNIATTLISWVIR